MFLVHSHLAFFFCMFSGEFLNNSRSFRRILIFSSTKKSGMEKWAENGVSGDGLGLYVLLLIKG